ncbi:MAG TPA: GDP-mannose 4,6-dehydratase [Solirubrobacteraceae bacterium]|nr:GDP-mannose 4,6-dehydratase [Solirubrobacteraceae bacterium]
MSTRSPRVLITGISGQDGSYLAELLCTDGGEVHGTMRPPIDREPPNLAGVREQVVLHAAELSEPGSLGSLVAELVPDEIYHLAAPAFVPESWRFPAVTVREIAGSGAELLQAVRDHAPDARVVLATSREIFGAAAPSPQDESTRAAPDTPYGIAKLAAHQLVGLARERDGLHASSAILYNHESPRRPAVFISHKVTRAAAAIKLGLEDELALGDLDAVRDWSAAGDIVLGLRAMARASEPADYVLASGVGHSVRQLVKAAFGVVGLEPDAHVRVDERFLRPPEPSDPIGNPRRAREQLGWSATTGFDELIAEMVRADLAELEASAGGLAVTRS